MRRTIQIAVTVFMFGLLSACASMITGGPLIRPGEPTGAIQLQNHSRATVTVVLISACEASTYGLNRLPEGVSIPPGRSFQWTVSAGCWDISAGYALSNGYAEARERFTVHPGRVFVYGVTGQ
jgi:hypothetical protein